MWRRTWWCAINKRIHALPRRNGFICILQYRKLWLESFKETTWCVLGRGMMEAVVDAPYITDCATGEKEDWRADAALIDCWSSWLSMLLGRRSCSFDFKEEELQIMLMRSNRGRRWRSLLRGTTASEYNRWEVIEVGDEWRTTAGRFCRRVFKPLRKKAAEW
jgi:hypothetical protein